MNTSLKRGLQFYVAQNPAYFGVDVHIRDNETGNLATNVIFEKKAMGEWSPAPLHLQPEDAQQLFDELWRAGFRSSEQTSKESALEATKFHLEDMRKLVFENRG